MEISQLGSDERVLEFALAGDIIQHYVNPSITSQFNELNGASVFDRCVMFDVSDVTFLDSNGIGWFVAVDSQFRKGGGKLILHSPSPVLQRIFAMMKMTTVITVASTRKAALDIADSLAAAADRTSDHAEPYDGRPNSSQTTDDSDSAAAGSAAAGSTLEDSAATRVEAGESA